MNSKTNPINISVIVVSFYIFFNTTALAGGLYLNEFGTPSMGVAGAGVNAVASDASTSFHNAAGMTLIKGTELMGSAGVLNATVKFDPDSDTPIPGGDGGDAGGFAPVIGGFSLTACRTNGSSGPALSPFQQRHLITRTTGAAAIRIPR